MSRCQLGFIMTKKVAEIRKSISSTMKKGRDKRVSYDEMPVTECVGKIIELGKEVDHLSGEMGFISSIGSAWMSSGKRSRTDVEILVELIERPSTTPGRFKTFESRRIIMHKSAVVKVLPFEVVSDRVKDLFEAVDVSNYGGRPSLGTDPEIFAVDTNDAVIPAFTYLGKKGRTNPFWDGFQAEFTVGYAWCMAAVTDSVSRKLREVLGKARQIDKKATLSWKSVMPVSDDILRSASPEHADLGCAPSTNAYPEIPPINIPDPITLNIRFAGCHVHLGLNSMHSVNDETRKVSKKEVLHTVKFLDKVFGPFSVLLFRGMEDKRRRQYYGRVGEYRTPEYGLEYRVPSSAMLCHPAIWHMCFELIRAAAMASNTVFSQLVDVSDADVIKAVNEYDYDLAEKIVKANEKFIVAMYRSRFHDDGTLGKFALEVANAGVLNWFGDKIYDMANSWHFSREWINQCGNIGCTMQSLYKYRKEFKK